MSLSSDIKEYALSLGYDAVGFTTADKFTFYEEELLKRRDMYGWAMEGALNLLQAADPHNILPEAKSVVVTVYDYFKQSFPQEMVGKIGRCYQAMGSRPPLPIHRARYRLLREFLEKRGIKVGRSITDLPARLSGARAGVTNYGKNCFAFAQGIGSFIVNTTMVVDTELEYDSPTFEVVCPEKCTLCIDACPTGALYKSLKMDPRRCVAYNSYMTPGSLIGVGEAVLPLDIRDSMGTWIYGCDVCQQVCPRNQPRLKAKLLPNPSLEHIAHDFKLSGLLNMTDEHFIRVVTLLGYITDKRYLQRNAAVALGNLGDDDAIPALYEAMQSFDELVRGHAAWALGKIGDAKAKRILEQSKDGETSKYVRDEINAALARQRTA